MNPTPTPAFASEDVIRSLCKESFYEFVKEFWEVLIPGEPVWNWHIEYLCDELQLMAERVFRAEPKLYDLIINIAPGSTKSTIVSIMYPAWLWTRFPEARVICGSYAHQIAQDLSRKCRNVIKSDKYQKIFDIPLSEDQDTKTYFQNTKQGYRFAVGAGGSVTGMHGHFILVDDPINPKGAVSTIQVKQVNDWLQETLSSRKIDKAITPTILVMQRLHQDDPSAAMLERKGADRVKHICIPAELTEHLKPDFLKKYYKDGLMDPVRISRSVLEDTRKDLGEFGYAGQFLQHPVPLSGGMFKMDGVKYAALEEGVKFTKVVRYWDKAGSAGKGCYTVGALMAKDTSGKFWLLDIVRGQWDSATRERIIKSTAITDIQMYPHHLVYIEQEGGSGGKESAENTVTMLAGFRVRVDIPKGDKVLRADPFSVQVNAGNFKVLKSNSILKPHEGWRADFVNELQYFPYSRYKDQVDACSGAFAALTIKELVAGAL